jgi:hypothetical protein
MSAREPSHPIDCFEWQSRATDFLDGTLLGPMKLEADQHVETCPTCKERNRRYRALLAQVAGQPKLTLPAPLKKAPFSAIVPPADVARGARSRWERVPWFIRTTIEGTSIVLLILLGISTGPKLRQFYERRIERSINEYGDAMTAGEQTSEIPLARGKTQAQAEDSGGNDEFSGEGEDSSEDASSDDAADGDNLHVGNSEIWRFNLKTDSPHDVRPKVVQVLRELRVSADTPGFGGIEAPGGIQFDVFLPKNVILELKRQLAKLAPRPGERNPDNPFSSDTFTWYKNKSKRKIPEGKTRVVIWLSQM